MTPDPQVDHIEFGLIVGEELAAREELVAQRTALDALTTKAKARELVLGAPASGALCSALLSLFPILHAPRTFSLALILRGTRIKRLSRRRTRRSVSPRKSWPTN